MSNRFLVRRGTDIPPIKSVDNPQGLDRYELGFSTNKKILYINSDGQNVIPIGGVVKVFDGVIKTNDLSDYELGFSLNDHLVYIKDANASKVIPVGCVPTSFYFNSLPSSTPQGHTVNVELRGTGMTTINTGEIPVWLPIASTSVEGVLSLTEQPIVGNKIIWGAASGLSFQRNDKDVQFKWEKRENGNLTLYLVDEEE